MTTATPAYTAYTVRALDALPTDPTGDLSAATPAQIDEAIRTLREEDARNGARLNAAADVVRRAIGQRPDERREGPPRARHTVVEWPTSWEIAWATAKALPVDTPSRDGYVTERTVGEAVAQVEALVAFSAHLTRLLAALDAEFDHRGGWARYYRVANTGGHVHTTTSCRNTYAGTAWTWPTQLSGATHADVVGAAGRFTCLTCFPNVRAEILADRPIHEERFETAEQTDARMARETEAAARKAEKIAKGITPDGSPLVVYAPSWRPEHPERVELRTERAAELRYVEFAARGGAHAEVAETVLAALAAKRGTTVEAQRAALAAKVARKAAQN